MKPEYIILIALGVLLIALIIVIIMLAGASAGIKFLEQKKADALKANANAPVAPAFAGMGAAQPVVGARTGVGSTVAFSGAKPAGEETLDFLKGGDDDKTESLAQATANNSDKTVMLGMGGAMPGQSMIELKTMDGKIFKTPINKEITIGRKTGEILLNFEPSVSGSHCKICKFGSTYTITDLNSSNGTQVNGSSITGPTAIHSGDKIMLGRLEMYVTIEN